MPGIGLQTAVGLADETTYGTWVTPTVWNEIVSESLEARTRTINSAGLFGARQASRGSRRVLVATEAGGSVELEAAQQGIGKWFKHALGAPTSAQQGGTAAYLHTFGMTSLPTGLSLQKLVRGPTGSNLGVFSYSGGRVLSLGFSCAVDEILRLSASMDFQKVVTTEAAGTPSFANTGLFHWGQGALLVDAGSVTALVTSVALTINNNLAVNRRGLGSGLYKSQPVDEDHPAVSGQLTAEFENTTDFYAAFMADTQKDLKLTFTGDVIAGAFSEKIEIDLDDVRFDGGTPVVSGPGIVAVNVPFTVLWDGTDPTVQLAYTSVDVSI